MANRNQMGDKEDQVRIDRLLDQRDWTGAATAIVEVYGPELLRFLRGVLRDEEQAREVFSDVCERLWKSLPSFRREASVLTWALRLAWFAAASHRRVTARRREQRLTTTEVSRIVQVVYERTPSVVKSGVEAKLDAIRASLDKEERSLLHLRVDSNLPWDQVAEIMSATGAPVDAAALRKRFQRLKEKLHDLAKRGGFRP